MNTRIVFLLLCLGLFGCQPANAPGPAPSVSATPDAATSTPLSSTPDETAPTAYSHATNFEWVAGRLEYSDLEGGTWTLHYAEQASDDDPHGGKFVLQGSIPESLKAGDLVVARGQIAEQQMGIHMAGSYYEFSSLSLLE
ncbi:MAG: hypothetical protein WC314_17770 [Vulcanimicrobiota bacterium]